MATATLIVTLDNPGSSNNQKEQIIEGTITLSGRLDSYAPGGLQLQTVMSQLEGLKSTTGKPRWVEIQGAGGLGYTYQYIPTTGKMMILQVPPSGSLTTAAPLQELTAAAGSLSSVFTDVIRLRAWFLRV